MIFFIVVGILFPMSAVTFSMNTLLEKKVQTMISSALENSLMSTEVDIGNVFKDMINAAANEADDPQTMGILRHVENYSPYDRQNFANSVANSANHYLIQENIQCIAVVVSQYGDAYNLFNYPSNPLRQQLIRASVERADRVSWYSQQGFDATPDSWVACSMPVMNADTVSVLGTVAIAVSQADFQHILRQGNRYAGSEIYIVDQSGSVVSSTMTAAIGKSISASVGMDTLRSGTDVRILKSDHKGKIIIAQSVLKQNGWTIVQILPYRAVFSEIDRIKQIDLLFLFLSLLVSVILTVLLSQTITRPLKRLKKRMDYYPQKGASISIGSTAPEEIVELNRAYDQLLGEIDSLIANIRFDQKQKEELRFKALQAQIHPHFLFNTLNNIKFMALINGSTEVGRMISCLGNMMEGSLGRGENMIRLSEEIRYVESYMYLQKIRYANVTFRNSVPEKLLDCQIIRFSIQPLVENSLIHGLAKMAGRGTIEVCALHREDLLEIRVKDNGEGIDPEKLRRLQAQLRDDESSQNKKIGLKNVHDRIRLSFGAAYGLSIDSRPGLGTQVTLRFPYIVKNQED